MGHGDGTKMSIREPVVRWETQGGPRILMEAVTRIPQAAAWWFDATTDRDRRLYCCISGEKKKKKRISFDHRVLCVGHQKNGHANREEVSGDFISLPTLTFFLFLEVTARYCKHERIFSLVASTALGKSTCVSDVHKKKENLENGPLELRMDSLTLLRYFKNKEVHFLLLFLFLVIVSSDFCTLGQ